MMAPQFAQAADQLKGKARLVKVQTGTETDRDIEVKGELAAGDRVVISGNYELSDGMAVRETP